MHVANELPMECTVRVCPVWEIQQCSRHLQGSLGEHEAMTFLLAVLYMCPCRARNQIFPYLSTVCQLSIRSIISKCKNLPALQEVVRPLQLDERMIALAAAISIDFDYFSQHSHGPGSVSHPVEHLMLRVIPLCQIKASVALG